MSKKKEMLEMTQKLAKVKVQGDFLRWPPYCAGILHQPKRPITSESQNK